MAFLSLLEFMSSTYQSAQEATAVLLREYAQHEREEREEREGQQLSPGRRTLPSARGSALTFLNTPTGYRRGSSIEWGAAEPFAAVDLATQGKSPFDWRLE